MQNFASPEAKFCIASNFFGRRRLDELAVAVYGGHTMAQATRSDRYKNRQAKKLIRSFVKKVKTEMGIRGNRFGWLGEKLGIGQRPNSPLAGYIKIIRNDLTL